MDLIRTLTDAQMKSDLPEIKTGDTVKVSAKVVEGNRERIQVFEGTVMCLRGGRSHQVCAFVGPTGPEGQPLFSLTGGIQDWRAAGLPIIEA